MFKKMKLGQKLILLFLLIGLLPMATTAIVLYTLTSNSLTEEVGKTLEMFVAETEKSFDERLSSHQENAKLIAQMKDLNAGLTAYYEAQISNYWDYSNEKESLLLFLQDLKREYQYNDLMITDKEGRVICATNNNLSSADLKNQDYIQTTLSGKATNSTLFYSTELSEAIMIMAAPIFGKIRQTEVIGVLGLFLDVDRIEELVLDGLDLVGKTADAYLIDQNQTLLTEPKVSQGFEILKTRIDTAGAKLLASAVRNRDDNYREFEVFHDYLGDKCLACLSVFNLGDHPVGFMMEIDYDEAYAAVKEMQTYAIALAGVIFILVIIIGLMFSRSISVPILKINEKLKLIAGGDFTVKLESKRSDEIGEMTDELNLTVEEISNVIYQIIVSAEKVHQASEEISSGNQDLSQRTQEQAATLEEITSTMEEVSSSIQQVAGNTEQADQISKATIAVVQEGEESIQETLGAMGQISASSRQIAEIIKVVNDIAFQTNLLALNAAVEAARAGEQGRGFAVVAAEVRNLAGRTAESAKEIEQLINESVDRVTKGHEMVKKSADILGEIVDNTKRTSDVIIEVAAAMREESSALQQIEASTEQLNQVTQQNAAMVEEMTSSSQLLNAEAENLRSMVEQFKINEKEHWTQRSVNNPQVKKEDKIKESSLLKSDDTTLAGFKQDSLKKF